MIHIFINRINETIYVEIIVVNEIKKEILIIFKGDY